MKESAYKGLGIWKLSLGPSRKNWNWSRTGSMTGILGQLKWESLKKRRKDSRLKLLYKGLIGKARIPKIILSRRICVVEFNIILLSRYFQPAKKRTKVVSFHRLFGTGMTSLVL